LQENSLVGTLRTFLFLFVSKIFIFVRLRTVGHSVIIAYGLHDRIGGIQVALRTGYPYGPGLTRKHNVRANVEATLVRCSGSLARTHTHTRMKDLHGTGVRY
jgi:hypothetical protein